MSDKPISTELLQDELRAYRYWTRQMFLLLGGANPADLAAWVRQRMAMLKQLAPPDDGSIPPAEYDAALVRVTPHIIDLGEDVAVSLKSYAQRIAAGEAIPPTLQVG